jgi:hypothetical protein
MKLQTRFLLFAVCCLLFAAPSAHAQGTPGTVRYPSSVDTLDSLFGRITDNPQTTLNGSISSSATTITTVASGTAAFGASGSLKIDNETIYYTGKSSNQFTGVLRGRDGTVATSHVSGRIITSPLLSVHHRTLANAIIAVEGVINSGSGFVTNLNGRTGAVSLQSSDLNGLSGAGLTGIGSGTGGVINTGSTTIGADSDADGVGVVALQTRGLTRLQVENAGRVTLQHPTGSGGFDLLRMNYNDPNGFGDFNFIQRLVVNTETPTNMAQAGRRDNVTQFGYNVSPTGKQVSGEHSFATALESRYITSGGNTQLEYYTEYISADSSASFRPVSTTIDLDGSGVINALAQDNLLIGDKTGNYHWLTLQSTTSSGNMTFFGDSGIILNSTRAAWLSKGGQSILSIASGDDITIGDGAIGNNEFLRFFPHLLLTGADAKATLAFGYEGAGLRFNGAAGAGNSGFEYQETRNGISNDWRRFNDQRIFDSGAYYPISIGAADSCGTGFRCLKIAN